jgi:hypothetical protein
MFTKKVKLPSEGDLLFEKKSPVKSGDYVFFAFGFIGGLFGVFDNFKERDWFDFGFYLVMALLLGFTVFWVLIDGFKNGFNDNTYKGYYFHDKIVFYRISKSISLQIAGGTTKELKIQLEEKNRELRNGEKANDWSTNWDFINLENRIKRSENLKKPFKVEVFFDDINYFLNEKKIIKTIDTSYTEGEFDYFYAKLYLASTYKKHPAEIVAFLNERVKACKAEEKVE